MVALFLALTGCKTLIHDDITATPQRPTVSSDTSTTAEGTAELESGVAIDPGDSRDIPLTLKIGLNDRTELFTSWSPYQKVDLPGTDGRGPGDVFIGTRTRLFEEKESRPSGALQLQTKLPAADEDEGLGSGEVDFFGAGILTKNLGPVTTTGFYQLGFLGEVDDDGTDLEHTFAIAASTSIGDGFSVFGEAAGIFTPEADDEQVFATTGIAFSPGSSIVFDAAVVTGLSDDAPDFQILFGVTTNLGRLWTPSDD